MINTYRSPLVHINGIPQSWIDFIVPATAIKDPIVSYCRLHMVQPHIRTDAAAQILCGHGLSDRTDIVFFAFYRKQRGTSDGLEIDRPPLILQQTERQGMFLEDHAYGFQIKLSR